MLKLSKSSVVVFPFAIGLTAAQAIPGPETVPLPLAVFHDNEIAAGDLSNGVLTVELKVVEADWRPYGPNEPGVMNYAFAEGDGEPMIPAPYLRAALGTRCRGRRPGASEEDATPAARAALRAMGYLAE